MDFGRTSLTGLLGTTAHEKAKFTALLHKLKLLLGLGKGCKLILTSIDKLLLTPFPNELYEHINYKHPITKILMEYLVKNAPGLGPSEYFIELAVLLLSEASFLLDNGMKPKRISDAFKDVAVEMDAFAAKWGKEEGIDGEMDKEKFVSEDIAEMVRQAIKEPRIAELLIEAMETTKSFDSEKIRVHKVPTGFLADSYRIDGMIIARKPEGVVESLTETSIGIFNCPLDINRPELKGTVLLKSHQELLNFNKDETTRIKALVDSFNVNAVVVCGKVDSLFLEFLNRRNILLLKVFSKFDLKRICDAVGGSIYNDLGPICNKGKVKKIAKLRDAGFDFTQIIGGSSVSTIVLKCSVKEILEMEEKAIVGLLESLAHSDSHVFSGRGFCSDFSRAIKGVCALKEAIRRALLKHNDRKMLLSSKVRSIRNALGLVAVLMEIDDYLLAKKDALNVKPPQHDGHWDEDH